MPVPTVTRPKRYLKRAELFAALDHAGIPSLAELGRVCGVQRPVISRIANGHDPVSERLELAIRKALGVSEFAAVDWIE